MNKNRIPTSNRIERVLVIRRMLQDAAYRSYAGNIAYAEVPAEVWAEYYRCLELLDGPTVSVVEAAVAQDPGIAAWGLIDA